LKMLLIDGVKYNLWRPTDEERDFHPIVRRCYKEIFSKDAVYFDVKHVLKTASGIGSIPDAYVVDFSKPELYVVEIELSSHPVYDHIVKQLTRFINSIENRDVKSQIVDMIYKEINGDPILKAIIQKMIGSQDIHYFLSILLSKPPRIAIIIDEKTSEIEDACKALRYVPEIVELRTFQREDAPTVLAHLFEPIRVKEKVSEKEGEKNKGLPEHYRNWEKRLEWTEENVKNIVEALTQEILKLGEVTQQIHGKHLCFYKGKPSTKSIFAAFLLRKNLLKVRIRTEPDSFKDPENWTGDKVYKGWFFKQGKEKEFRVTSLEQIPYAMRLIEQSYAFSQEGSR